MQGRNNEEVKAHQKALKEWRKSLRDDLRSVFEPAVPFPYKA